MQSFAQVKACNREGCVEDRIGSRTLIKLWENSLEGGAVLHSWGCGSTPSYCEREFEVEAVRSVSQSSSGVTFVLVRRKVFVCELLTVISCRHLHASYNYFLPH